MTILELKQRIDNLLATGTSEDTPVVVMDIENDEDSSFHMYPAKDINFIKVKSKQLMVLTFQS